MPDSAAFSPFAAKTRDDDAQQNELLQEMQRVLSGCLPKTSCTPVRAPEMTLSGKGAGASRGENGRSGDLQGSLAQASSFAENFLLEYAEGLPGNQIGWGNVNERQLRRFLWLHSDYFNLMHRTPKLARIEASNMLFHIACTLEQGVEQRPVANAVGPVNSKVVILAGHDTNIAAIAALLGLHWTLDGRSDDTPPGTELSFELWQNDHGAWSVRVTVAMQTLNQLRTLQDLTPAAPPAHETLSVERCGAETDSCAWDEFLRITDAAIDKDDVVPAQPN
jgi:4-phytase/acid phosphatase